jgi:4-amino-4-deoxy-L-arabinose transferase-like glycosyltransferase
MKALASNRFREAAETAAVFAAFAVGVALRVANSLRWHPPEQYMYSDANSYVRAALEMNSGEGVRYPWQMMHPPGTAMVLAASLRIAGTLKPAVVAYIVVSCLVPLASYVLARRLFDRTNARWVLVLISFHYLLIDFGSRFMTDIFLAAFFPLALWLVLISLDARGVKGALVGLLAGATLSVAYAFKVIALPAGIAFFAVLVVQRAVLASPRSSLRALGLRLLAVGVGFAPILVALTVRCTRVAGRLCLGSNGGSPQILLGHIGRVGYLKWNGPDGVMTFISGSDAAHGYLSQMEVGWSVVDEAQNLAMARQWCKAHPIECLARSAEHVYSTFGGAYTWPPNMEDQWALSYLAHFLLIVFFIIPWLSRVGAMVVVSGFRGFLASPEALATAPLVALAAAVAYANGEPRYRLPFDGLIACVAVEAARALLRARAHGRGGAGSSAPTAPTAPRGSEPLAAPRDDHPLPDVVPDG